MTMRMAEEDCFYVFEVFFGVYAYGVEVGGFYVDADAVFEEAELFEALGVFEGAGGQGGEALEGGFAVGVEADVLPVLRGACRRGRRGWWRGRSRGRGRRRR